MSWKDPLGRVPYAALLALAACGPAAENGAEDPTRTTVAAPAPEPSVDTGGLLARAKARWDAVANDDWIQAFDYLEPSRRAQEKLPGFLNGKEAFRYRNPSEPRLVATEGELAYVAVDCEWTHEQIARADNLPAGDAMQALRSVELWARVDGEWYWRATQPRGELERERPELFAGE